MLIEGTAAKINARREIRMTAIPIEKKELKQIKTETLMMEKVRRGSKRKEEKETHTQKYQEQIKIAVIMMK